MFLLPAQTETCKEDQSLPTVDVDALQEQAERIFNSLQTLDVLVDGCGGTEPSAPVPVRLWGYGIVWGHFHPSLDSTHYHEEPSPPGPPTFPRLTLKQSRMLQVRMRDTGILPVGNRDMQWPIERLPWKICTGAGVHKN